MPAPIAVVLAEDEPFTRMMAADALRDQGFKVMEAANAEEALDILHAHACDVHVLFTDIHMPGAMDGLALAHHAALNWPWISFLIASGRARPDNAELPARSRFVAKPYRHDHVIGHIREMA